MAVGGDDFLSRLSVAEQRVGGASRAKSPARRDLCGLCGMAGEGWDHLKASSVNLELANPLRLGWTDMGAPPPVGRVPTPSKRTASPGGKHKAKGSKQRDVRV